MKAAQCFATFNDAVDIRRAITQLIENTALGFIKRRHLRLCVVSASPLALMLFEPDLPFIA